MGLTALFTLLAVQGKITGDLPREPGEREMWQQAGIKPTSFSFGVPFSDQRAYIDYRGAEIWSNLARTVANLFGDADVLGESLVRENLTRISFLAGSLLVDNGPLSGLTDLSISNVIHSPLPVKKLSYWQYPRTPTNNTLPLKSQFGKISFSRKILCGDLILFLLNNFEKINELIFLIVFILIVIQKSS